MGFVMQNVNLVGSYVHFGSLIITDIASFISAICIYLLFFIHAETYGGHVLYCSCF